MDTLTFLRRVLPGQGFYCLFLLSADGPRTLWFDSLDQMAEAAGKFDSKGFDVYHACASYNMKTRRVADNAAWVRSIWMDIDVGKDKGPSYPTLPDAWTAFKQFIKVSSFELPGIVKSGGGLHIYFPLDEDVEAHKAVVVMRQLKEIAKAHGLALDPSRSADLASVLRPVGTFNHKYDPARPVEWIGK